MENYQSIWEQADDVFRRNRLGNGVITPEIEHFNGSFLWDAALVAKARALKWPHDADHQLQQHLRGQLANGMIPNEVVFHPRSPEQALFLGYTKQSPGVNSSAITQPPILANAARAVAEQLPATDRRAYLRKIFPQLLHATQWLFDNRADESDGLLVVTHPYESGMDNSPVWDNAMDTAWDDSQLKYWQRIVKSRGPAIINRFRNHKGDLLQGELAERSQNTEITIGLLQLQELRRYSFNITNLKERSSAALIKDVGFNALAAYANEDLLWIEATISDSHREYEIPEPLYDAIQIQRQAIDDTLWDDVNGAYYGLDARTNEHIRVLTAGSLLPLLTSEDSHKIRQTVDRITDSNQFWTLCPIPSVAANDCNFNPQNYWRGPSWPFMRLFVFEALVVQGYESIASDIASTVLEQSNTGFGEYINPLTGTILGMRPFSPAAAEAQIYINYLKDAESDLSTGS